MFIKCIKSIGRWFKYYWKDLLSWVITIIGTLGIFAFGFILCLILARGEIIYLESMVESPEPVVCALCRNGDGVKIHAPCIINLSTGEVAELSVYEPDPNVTGEVMTELNKGYFSFFGGAGANIMQNQEKELCEATLPKDEKKMDPRHFCYNCRRIIADIDKNGYVIADMYDPKAVSVFKVWDGAKYEIRDYLVTVNKNENRCFEIEVHGLLNQVE
jgi:hypothetical protein